MIPDLGKYAVWVLAAYGVSLTLLVGLVALSLQQARRTLAELRRMEESRPPQRRRGPETLPREQAPVGAEERANG